MSALRILASGLVRQSAGRTAALTQCMRTLSVSAPRLAPQPQGLMQFFPTKPIDLKENYGRQWKASDLRLKSNVDLHKLWYVLLKEKNMLLTLKHDALRNRQILPAKDRFRKVRKAMAAIKVVLSERERALEDYKFLAGTTEEPVALSESETREQTDAQKKQLLGVNRPGLAHKGLPQRPMTKRERLQFRQEVRSRRKAVEEAELQEVVAGLKRSSDDVVKEKLAEVDEWRACGVDDYELPRSAIAVLNEATARGMTPRFPLNLDPADKPKADAKK